MIEQTGFSAALDAIEQLDEEAQAELVEVLSRRLAERGRERVAAAVAQARREFAAGQCQPMTAVEIVRRGAEMRRILLRSPAFARDLRNWLKSHPRAAETIQAVLDQLSADASHSSLRTHKFAARCPASGHAVRAMTCASSSSLSSTKEPKQSCC